MSLVMSKVRVVSVMPRVMPMPRVLQVMLWLMVPLIMPMVRVLQVMVRSTVPLVMMMVRVLWVWVRAWMVAGRCWAWACGIPGWGPGWRHR